MSGLLQRIADAVYREYDRRIKRASLITEYGVSHHHDHEEAHDDHEVAIVNLPPRFIGRRTARTTGGGSIGEA